MEFSANCVIHLDVILKHSLSNMISEMLGSISENCFKHLSGVSVLSGKFCQVSKERKITDFNLNISIHRSMCLCVRVCVLRTKRPSLLSPRAARFELHSPSVLLTKNGSGYETKCGSQSYR